MEEEVMSFSKKLITQTDSADTAFKGEKVINCSIEPKGVCKAQIDEISGVVTFTKYDPTWNGEVHLSLETSDADNEEIHYNNDFTVVFGSEELDDEVQILSEDEEDDIIGGGGVFYDFVPARGECIGKTIVRVKVGQRATASIAIPKTPCTVDCSYDTNVNARYSAGIVTIKNKTLRPGVKTKVIIKFTPQQVVSNGGFTKSNVASARAMYYEVTVIGI